MPFSIDFDRRPYNTLALPCECVIVMEAISTEFRVALSSELLYADELVAIAETEEDLIQRLNDWKNNVENRGTRVNMNKTKLMISGERQKQVQKPARRLCGVCGRAEVLVLIRYNVLVVRSGYTRSVVRVGWFKSG